MPEYGIQGVCEPVSSADGSSSQGTVSTVSTQSTPHPRAKVIPAGRAPCELGWELRDQTPLPLDPPPAQAKLTVRARLGGGAFFGFLTWCATI